MTIKNLPADYLLAAQQGDIDKVKTCLALGVDINTCLLYTSDAADE